MSKEQRRYVADVAEGEFYREPPLGPYTDTAGVWLDDEGHLVLATGEDGFGIHFNSDELEQFIAFLRASMPKPHPTGEQSS